MLALASGLAALILLVCSLVIKSVTVNFLVALTLGMLNLALLSCFLRPVIAKINAFYFLQSIFHIGTHGAAFYFFTDTEESYRDGPHFSYQFYVTGMGCVAAGCSLLGAACYNLLAKKWTYRSMLMSTSLAYALANGLSVIAYKRINIKYGIPDAGFMLASSAMQTVLGQLAWMPMTVMLAQLVPQGLESVMCLSKKPKKTLSKLRPKPILSRVSVKAGARSESTSLLWPPKVCIALGFAEFGLRRRQLRRGPRS